jgi:hypothetical protein
VTPKQKDAAITILVQCLEEAQKAMAQVFNDPENPKNGQVVGMVFNDNKDMLRLIKKKLG